MRSNKLLIFKPSDFTWRLGKCDQAKIEYVASERMRTANAVLNQKYNNNHKLRILILVKLPVFAPFAAKNH
jgi:hypothetical protein